jgi:hypothetical protein
MNSEPGSSNVLSDHQFTMPHVRAESRPELRTLIRGKDCYAVCIEMHWGINNALMYHYH